MMDKDKPEVASAAGILLKYKGQAQKNPEGVWEVRLPRNIPRDDLLCLHGELNAINFALEDMMKSPKYWRGTLVPKGRRTNTQTLYDIISAYDRPDLIILINRRIEDGWKLQGGVSSVFDQNDECTIYSQAMTKEVQVP